MGNVWDGVVKTDIRDEFKLCNIYAKDKCTNCFANSTVAAVVLPTHGISIIRSQMRMMWDVTDA